MMVVGLFIALLAGVFVYNDARTLRDRGIQVGSSSPAAWGWLNFLLLIVGLPLYLVQRSKAVSPRNARIAMPVTTGGGAAGARFCGSCGAAFDATSRFCASCGAGRPKA